jgi:hypothetical protein
MRVMNVCEARTIFELLTPSCITICLAFLSLFNPIRRNAILFKAVTAEDVGIGSPVVLRFLYSQLLLNRLLLFLVHSLQSLQEPLSSNMLPGSRRSQSLHQNPVNLASRPMPDRSAILIGMLKIHLFAFGKQRMS